MSVNMVIHVNCGSKHRKKLIKNEEKKLKIKCSKHDNTS